MDPAKVRPIIVVKRKVNSAAHHGGAWKVAYADFVTAMMAFFLLMWLLGSTTDGDKKGIADYFASPLKVAMGGGSGSGDSSSIIKGGGTDLTRSSGQVKRGDVQAPRSSLNLQALKENQARGETAKLEELPDDPGHPFLSRKTSALGFATAWSVRLRSNGFHINHFHPKGWLSSALYVDIPDTLDEAHGALAFGVPDAAFGLDLTPRRIEVPSPGKLVIFPSYLWHGTLPFESDQPRLTVAFDALPV